MDCAAAMVRKGDRVAVLLRGQLGPVPSRRTAHGVERPRIIDIDFAPFASSTFKCLLEHPRSEDHEGRSTLRSLFGGLPLTLFGAAGGLSIIEIGDTEASYEEELFAVEAFADEASEIAAGYGPWKRVYARARLIDQEPQVTLDGSVQLHPDVSSDLLVPVLNTWPAQFIRRIGFELEFHRAAAPWMELDDAERSGIVFEGAVGALRTRGPILRNDSWIGAVSAIDPIAELGIFCTSESLTMSFQRRGDGDLWCAVKDFPLRELLRDILARLPTPTVPAPTSIRKGQRAK